MPIYDNYFAFGYTCNTFARAVVHHSSVLKALQFLQGII